MGQVSGPKYWTKNRARGFLIVAVKDPVGLPFQSITFPFLSQMPHVLSKLVYVVGRHLLTCQSMV